MFCCTLLDVHPSIAIILMGKRELVALLNSSSWCLVMVEQLFFAVPQGCLRFVIVVFPDHTHLLFLTIILIIFQAEQTETNFRTNTGAALEAMKFMFDSEGYPDSTWVSVLITDGMFNFYVYQVIGKNSVVL